MNATRLGNAILVGAAMIANAVLIAFAPGQTWAIAGNVFIGLAALGAFALSKD